MGFIRGDSPYLFADSLGTIITSNRLAAACLKRSKSILSKPYIFRLESKENSPLDCVLSVISTLAGAAESTPLYVSQLYTGLRKQYVVFCISS